MAVRQGAVRARRVGGKGRSVIRQNVSFSTINHWKDRWEAIYDQYRGSYLLFCRPVMRRKHRVVVAMLHVYNLGPNGIHFHIDNVDTERSLHDPRWYRYEGLMFPVDQWLYFIGEEITTKYEMLNLVCGAAPAPQPDLLEGHLMAIGVRGSDRRLATVPMVLSLFSREIVAPDHLVGERIGVFEEFRVPRDVLDLLADLG